MRPSSVVLVRLLGLAGREMDEKERLEVKAARPDSSSDSNAGAYGCCLVRHYAEFGRECSPLRRRAAASGNFKTAALVRYATPPGQCSRAFPRTRGPRGSPSVARNVATRWDSRDPYVHLTASPEPPRWSLCGHGPEGVRHVRAVERSAQADTLSLSRGGDPACDGSLP